MWLPLPHLLDMLPVQIDVLYRTGAFAIAHLGREHGAGGLGAAARLIAAHDRIRRPAALAAAALLLANPNLLYLQSTPMTEPLLFGDDDAGGDAGGGVGRRAGRAGWPHAAGLALTAACMTRYEAWPITAAIVRPRRRRRCCAAASPPRGASRVRPAVRYPGGRGRAVRAEQPLDDWRVVRLRPGSSWPRTRRAARAGWRGGRCAIGTYQLSGWMLVWPAYVSAVLIAVAFVRSRAACLARVVLALAASAALPWYAYFNGHPLRVRYSLPLVFAALVLCGIGIGLLPRRVRHRSRPLCSSPACWCTTRRSIGGRRWSSRRSATTPTAPDAQAVTAYLMAHFDPSRRRRDLA